MKVGSIRNTSVMTTIRTQQHLVKNLSIKIWTEIEDAKSTDAIAKKSIPIAVKQRLFTKYNLKSITSRTPANLDNLSLYLFV